MHCTINPPTAAKHVIVWNYWPCHCVYLLTMGDKHALHTINPTYSSKTCHLCVLIDHVSMCVQSYWPCVTVCTYWPYVTGMHCARLTWPTVAKHVIVCTYWPCVIVCTYWPCVTVCTYWPCVIVCTYWPCVIVCTYWTCVIVCTYWPYVTGMQCVWWAWPTAARCVAIRCPSYRSCCVQTEVSWWSFSMLVDCCKRRTRIPFNMWTSWKPSSLCQSRYNSWVTLDHLFDPSQVTPWDTLWQVWFHAKCTVRECP